MTVDATAAEDTGTALRRPVGFYVHYHGRGHRNRTLAILRELATLDRPAAILTSRMDGLDWPEPVREVIDVACDIDDVPAAGQTRAEDSPALHFAPLHTATIRRRVHQLAEWFDRTNPAALVVDVSCEVAMLARLASVPTVVMRQHGDRRDPAHETAYHAADRLLAPFPERLEDELTPEWVREKTTYAAGFCRYADPPPDREAARTSLGWSQPTVVVMSGRGGRGSSVAGVVAAAAATPDWQWVLVGLLDEDLATLPANVVSAGWVSDPLPMLAGADVVVSAGGHNSVMELAHARARAIIRPEPRPFDEQVRKAAILDREGLAIVSSEWPAADRWPALLRRASQLDATRWAAITEGEQPGAAALAAAIEDVCRQSDAVAASPAPHAAEPAGV